MTGRYGITGHYGRFGDMIHNPLSADLMSASSLQLGRSFIGVGDFGEIMQCVSCPRNARNAKTWRIVISLVAVSHSVTQSHLP